MKKKVIFGIIGGFLGLLVGLILGGYIGLVIGGTFLGGLDLNEKIGIEGYELSTYIGAIIGAVITTIYGIKLSLKKLNSKI